MWHFNISYQEEKKNYITKMRSTHEKIVNFESSPILVVFLIIRNLLRFLGPAAAATELSIFR